MEGERTGPVMGCGPDCRHTSRADRRDLFRSRAGNPAGRNQLPRVSELHRQVKGGHYDVGSNKFTVDHEDGTTVDLPYARILADVKAAKTPAAGPPGSRTVSGLSGYVRDRRTQRIHPLQYDETTTPNLAAMVLETESVIQNSQSFFEISKAFLEIIAVYAQVKMASAGMRPGWKAVPWQGAGGTSEARVEHHPRRAWRRENRHLRASGQPDRAC